MIEVERKFICSENHIERLLQKAAFQSKVVHVDQFFDFADLRLAKGDRWLRRRDGQWELKVSEDPHYSTRKADIYEELTDEGVIQQRLGFDLDKALFNETLQRFTSLQTTRSHYVVQEGDGGASNGYGIDIDDVVSLEDDFHYRILEIEILVKSTQESEAAAQRILDIAERFDLDLTRPLGKVLAYLQQKKPVLFAELEQAWHRRLWQGHGEQSGGREE